MDAEITPKRRRSMLAGLGVAAFGAGAAVWWLNRSESQSSIPDAQAGLQALWAFEGELPNGARFSMQSLHGHPLLLNFWATWCPPCIEELPLLDRFYQQNAGNGWQLVAIAADKADAVKRYLAQHPVTFPTPIAGLEAIELSRQLGNANGGLPYSIILDASGKITMRQAGAWSPESLRLALNSIHLKNN